MNEPSQKNCDVIFYPFSNKKLGQKSSALDFQALRIRLMNLIKIVNLPD